LRTSDLLADLQRTFGLTMHRRRLERLLRGPKNFRVTECGTLLRRCGRLREFAQLRPMRDGRAIYRGDLACCSAGIRRRGAAPCRRPGHVLHRELCRAVGRWRRLLHNHPASDRGGCPCVIRVLLPAHLSRNAYLYIRQSTLRQVSEKGVWEWLPWVRTLP
jgi:hypothetical protein